jgi:CRISPR-associated protein Csm4
MDAGKNHRSPMQKGLQFYRSTLTLRSFTATSWQADTVFGHLCWFLVRHQGEAALKQFLARYMRRRGDGNPPILVSDGFPADYLPRPIQPGMRLAMDSSKRQRIEQQLKAKQPRPGDWLTLDDFNRVRRDEPITDELSHEVISAAIDARVTTKNWINRATDTAGDPFDVDEHLLPHVTIYWRIEDGYLEMVNEFLEDLQATGYGKRKSIGYGQVESFTLKAFDGFADVPEANGFVTLSRFVPAPDDPTDGYWKAIVKYGKLGEEFAASPNPFKRPLVQLACGSCFRTTEPRDWYGQLLEGLSIREEIKHYAFAFPLPMHLPNTE